MFDFGSRNTSAIYFRDKNGCMIPQQQMTLNLPPAFHHSISGDFIQYPSHANINEIAYSHMNRGYPTGT